MKSREQLVKNPSTSVIKKCGSFQLFQLIQKIAKFESLDFCNQNKSDHRNISMLFCGEFI